MKVDTSTARCSACIFVVNNISVLRLQVVPLPASFSKQRAMTTVLANHRIKITY